MSYNKTTRTITLDPDSDFIVDAGTHLILTLKKLSIEKEGASDTHADWKIIERWLGCEGRGLSSADEEKIGKAWRAYISIGLAPSFTLQGVFDKVSDQYKRSGNSLQHDKAPTEVMDVFDRLLATKSEISQKRAHDIEVERKKFDQVFKSIGKKQPLKNKLLSLPKSSRILITLALAWTVWVVFRTSDYYEFLGIDFERWDDDMFFANLVVPPTVLWLSYKAYEWISRASK